MGRLTGPLLIVFALAIFASWGIYVREVPVSQQMILFFFNLVGAIALFFVVYQRKEFVGRKFFPMLLALTVVTILNDFLYFTAFRTTTIANAILTHYTAPIFVAVFAPLFLKENLEKITIVSIILSFAGLFLMVYSSGFDANIAGIAAGTGSGLFYGLMIIVYKKLTKDISVYTANFYRFLMSTIVLAPFAFVEGVQINFIPMLVLGALLYYVFAASIHIEGVKRVKAQSAGVIGYVEPVFGAIYAFFFFSEVPSLLALFGGILIIFSGYLIVTRTQYED